jgi:hypothetical protein
MQSLTPAAKKFFGLLFFIVVLLILFYLGSYIRTQFFSPQKDFAVALTDSTTAGDAVALQDFFVEKVKEGSKSNETISSIHWITHRYFDNGGDIYELYDFINEHPEIAFLKNAEEFYPDIFEKIRNGTLEKTYSFESIAALLSYYKVIDESGYGGIALWGTAANKHSEQALYTFKKAGSLEAMAPKDKEYFDYAARMAMKYAKKANFYIYTNTQKTYTLEDLRLVSDIIPDDLLVGLNQYASAVQNLRGAGIEFATNYDPVEIFDFNSQYALDFVPRLYFFTNYLHASSLVNAGKATPESVALPLARCIEYAEQNTEWRPAGSIYRVINAKTSNESSLFSADIVRALAAESTPFKDWLTKNGWKESDF